ncbi:hypothetical protein DOTSEDRAFT_39118 [Dothistroma septosporum NZE10]|uniref:Uncharacterized protein n=1 Tax=Dothistroma septosporum (strain NZE10 / CBS 128990) TaxID=675120 RepID=M2YJ36_DOTSN|nr:hypothetical protein DOTSEDRAFT_39118 [Dothistroma septosporum NZE10]
MTMAASGSLREELDPANGIEAEVGARAPGCQAGHVRDGAFGGDQDEELRHNVYTYDWDEPTQKSSATILEKKWSQSEVSLLSSWCQHVIDAQGSPNGIWLPIDIYLICRASSAQSGLQGEPLCSFPVLKILGESVDRQKIITQIQTMSIPLSGTMLKRTKVPEVLQMTLKTASEPIDLLVPAPSSSPGQPCSALCSPPGHGLSGTTREVHHHDPPRQTKLMRRESEA